MYRIVTVQDRIRVPPAKFGLELEEAVRSSLQDRWEGITDRKLGIVLAVAEVSEVGEGKILPGDGAIYYPAMFKLLVYRPEMHEAARGEVIDVTEFGIFVRIGPTDGMVHVSQIMDDFVSYDAKTFMFTGKESRRTIKESDTVKTRIISVSMEKEYKIGLTLRQQGLGVLGWSDKRKEKAPEKEAKKEKKR